MISRTTALAGTALALVLASPLFAAGLDARLSSSQIASGDQVVLSLSTDATGGAAQPDFSPLEQDFTILGTSSGTQTTIVNGARSDRVTWQITLSPKQDGTLTIPAIAAGRVSSEPLALSVVELADLPPSVRAGRPEISVSLPDRTVYAHQELPLTVSVRLPAGTQDAEIRPPETPGLLIEQSGQARVSRQPDGTSLLEATYLLRPQGEGQMTLPAFTVLADVADPNARSPVTALSRSPFAGGPFAGMFNASPIGGSLFGSTFAQTKRMTATGAPISLEVQATPGGATGWALPAQGVELRESWQPDPPVFKVGEAVTRKIQVLALGAHAEQIPDLILPEVAGARVYAEGSDKRSVPTEKGTMAIREFTWSILPTSGGDMVLPEVSVEWFDTISETTERATLPATTFHVDGPVSEPVTRSSEQATVVDPTRPAPTKSTEKWLTIALIGGSIGLLAFIGLAVRAGMGSSRKTERSAWTKIAPVPALAAASTRKAALARAGAAAEKDERAQLHRAALDWIRASGVPLDAAQIRFPDLMAAMSILEAELFGQRPATDTAPRALVRALKSAERDLAGPKQTRSPLPPLYPVPGQFRVHVR